MKKQKRKRKVKGYSQAVSWNPELYLRQLGVTKLDWERAKTATEIKLANRKLCSVIKKRLLRRWKGTPLEVKTLCWGPMQRDDEVGGKEMDSWLDFVPAPPFSTVQTISTTNESAVMKTTKFSGTFSTL